MKIAFIVAYYYELCYNIKCNKSGEKKCFLKIKVNLIGSEKLKTVYKLYATLQQFYVEHLQ